MSTTAARAETLDLESADPPEASPSTGLEPRPEEEHAEPEGRRGDVDDLPRIG